MKRRIAIITVLLILGAIVNVAVAIASAMWSPLDFAESNDAGETGFEIWQESLAKGLLPPSVQGTRPDEWVRLRQELRASLGYEICIVNEIIDSPPLSFPSRFAWHVLSGWPYRTFAGVRTGYFFTHGGQALGKDLSAVPPAHREVHLISIIRPRAAGGRTFRMVPLRPLWPGFFINTLFYAILLWLLFAALFAARRMIRRRRGLCEKCAYPIGVSPVCTECGAAVSRRPSEGAA